MLRLTILALLCGIGLIGLSEESPIDDPLDRLCGEVIHTFYRGEPLAVIELAETAIAYGSEDPRVYYFRGLALWQLGKQDVAELNFEMGAYLEMQRVDISSLKLTDVHKFNEVNRSLERIQGSSRSRLESFRSEVRPIARLVREFKKAQVERFREEFRAKVEASQIAAKGVDGIRGRVISINSTPVRVVDVEQSGTDIAFLVGVPEEIYQKVTTQPLRVASSAAWRMFLEEVEPHSRTYWPSEIGSINEEGLQLEYDPYRDVLTDPKQAAEGRVLFAQHGPIIWHGKTIQDHRVWTLHNGKKPKATVIGLNVANVQLREWSWDEDKPGLRDKGDGAVFLVNIDDLSQTDQRWLKDNYPDFAVERAVFDQQRAYQKAQDERRREVENEIAREQTRLQDQNGQSDRQADKLSATEPDWEALLRDLISYGKSNWKGFALYGDGRFAEELGKRDERKFQRFMGHYGGGVIRKMAEKNLRSGTGYVFKRHLKGHYSQSVITQINHTLWSLANGELPIDTDPTAATLSAIERSNPDLKGAVKLTEVIVDFYENVIKKK